MKRHLHYLLSFSCLAAFSQTQAETVVWTATGAVSQASGTFGTNGISVDDPVSVMFSYDDEAARDTTRDLRPLFAIVDYEYREAINLKIAITIGDHIWSGSVETGRSGSPRTMQLKVSIIPENEKIELIPLLTPNDDATFSSFPFSDDGDADQIQLLIRSNDGAFLQDGISLSAIDTSLIELANGSIQTGSTTNTIGFNLDPSSLMAMNEEVIPLTPKLQLIQTNDNLAISWATETGFDYKLESATELDAETWNEVSKRPGNGGTLDQNIAIIPDGKTFFRVVVTPEEKL